MTHKIIVLKGNGLLKGSSLPLGCQLCQKGMKVVYFMGGGCNKPLHCKWYCPISEERKSDSIHYIDEIPIPNPTSIESTVNIIVDEINNIDAYGMSLTGGDPLTNSYKVDWATNIIYSIKTIMGKDFHIHLYTSGANFSRDIADRLEQVGLDDLRFHPAVENFHKMEFALDHQYTVAAEVPVIPTEEYYHYLLKLADHLDSIGADFLNLNEFEMCVSNQEALLQRGFKLKPNSIAAVDGSRKYAIRFINEFQPQSSLKIHFCSIKMKDQIQLQERYKRRARKIKYPYEEISEEGTLLFLRIQGAVQEIQQIFHDLINLSGVPPELLGLKVNQGILDLPSFLGENNDFIGDLAGKKVKIGIVETLPFHEKELQKIVEYTPISIPLS